VIIDNFHSPEEPVMPQTATAIIARVREFITENFLYMRPDMVLGDDDRLLERGIIDSMGVLEVLTFLEDEYGVKPDDDEISEANLGSLAAIARFVVAKRTDVAA
jgi:acyl carrier protein